MEKNGFANEEKYLERVEALIRSRLEKLHADKAALKEQVVQERKDMWDDNTHLARSFDDLVLLSSQDANMRLTENQYERNEAEIRRLSKMEDSPYFGRLLFEEGDTGEDSIYIGIYSLAGEDSREIYVVDWRAPIASMFYQSDLGPAWYEVHGHRVEARLTGKRQYRIEGGRLLSVYDTDSSMYDNILGEVLSKSSGHRLKVIVNSIQKEQNLAIRSDTRRSCLIYGLAGSGKTSIGLHRLAYVLYCNRDSIKAENVLILSNNSIFESYISTLLPDLGERPAETKVFSGLLEAYMDKGIRFEDYYSQLKRIENNPGGERTKWLKVKYSTEFLQYCIGYFASFPFQIPEIRYKEETVISPELLQGKLDSADYPTFKARYERLAYLAKKSVEDFFTLHKDEICKDILDSHDGFITSEEVSLLYQRLRLEYKSSAQEQISRHNRLEPQRQMTELLSSYLRQTGEGNEEAIRLSESLERGRLLYEDALYYLFIKVLMGEAAPFPGIYHAVIDEAQDYSLLQLYIIKYLFPRSSFTLLGDIYQAVNSVTAIQDYADYERIFGSGLIQIRLSKCYRSSSDINALAFQLINEAGHPMEEGYSYFTRPVKKPQYISARDMLSCLVPVLERLEQYNSVAVIVDSDEDALAVKSRLGDQKEAQLILSPEDEIKGRLVIIPLLLAKGLEFDAVILYNCIYPNERNTHLRRKVYLGCTRALHELYLVERDILPDALQDCRPYMEMCEWNPINL